MANYTEIVGILKEHPDVIDAVMVTVDVRSQPTLLAAVKVREYCGSPLLREYACAELGSSSGIDGVLIFDDFPYRDDEIDLEKICDIALERADEVVFQAPHDELEERLAEMWASMLHLRRVGVNDDFLDLGGDSLTAQEVVFGLEKQWDLHIEISELIEASTVRGLAEVLREKERMARG